MSFPLYIKYHKTRIFSHAARKKCKFDENLEILVDSGRFWIFNNYSKIPISAKSLPKYPEIIFNNYLKIPEQPAI